MSDFIELEAFDFDAPSLLPNRLSAASEARCIRGNLTEETSKVLAAALPGTTVTRLILSSNRALSPSGWQTVFEAICRSSVTSVSVHYCMLSDASAWSISSAITSCDSCPLKELIVSENWELTPTGIRRVVRAAAGLDSLSLASCEIDDAKAIALARALSGAHRLSTASPSAPASLPVASLRVLDISRNPGIGESGWRALTKGLGQVETLVCRGCSLDDVRIRSFSLQGNTCLRKLDVSFSPAISASGWRLLMDRLQQTALETLVLTGSQLDGGKLAGFAGGLAGNSALRRLVLDENKACEDGLGSLFAALASTGVAEISLAACALDDDCIASISDRLPGNASLRRLNLSKSANISALGWEDLGRGLAQCQVSELEVRGCLLLEMDTVAFAEALAGSRVNVVDVSESEITAVGAEALMQHPFERLIAVKCLVQCSFPKPKAVVRELLLRENPDLVDFSVLEACTMVDLSDCALDDAKATALGRAIAASASLERLVLAENSYLSAVGWRAIFSGVAANASLKHVSVADCALVNAKVDAIAAAFESACDLEVAVRGNPFVTRWSALERLVRVL